MWLDSLVNVKLSTQRALLGRLSPEVRAVTVESDGGRAVLRVYHDGPLAPETEDEFGDAVTEIMADVPSDEPPAVQAEFERVDAPSQLEMSGWPVYARKEPPPVAG